MTRIQIINFNMNKLTQNEQDFDFIDDQELEEADLVKQFFEGADDMFISSRFEDNLFL